MLGKARTIRSAAALLLAGIALLLLLAPVTIAQGPSGVGGKAPASQAAPAAATPKEPPAAQVPVAAAPAKPTLADLAWLAGSWQGTWGPRAAQQIWASPGAGVMPGAFQLAESNKTLVIELFTLAETPDGIELRIRHFTPSLVPWEKDGPTVLRLASADANSAVFENPVNGEPRTQSFRRADADTYVSRSEVMPPEGGPQVAEIIFHRVRVPSTASKHKTARNSE